MEAYRKKLRIRFVVYIILGIIMALLTVLTCLYSRKSNQDFLLGFRSGVGFAVSAMLLMKAFEFKKALGSNEKIKKMYINETDERTVMICQKISSLSFEIVSICIMFSMIISSFYNTTVFCTLLCVGLFMALVKITVKFITDRL